VNEFVEECRSEWKRLGVPDPVANEMAADLAADLAEAEAEGASAEDVLGSGAFDPRAFATAWAAERGLIRQPPPPSGQGAPRRARLLVAMGAFALIAIVGAVLVVLPSSSGPERMALASAPLGPWPRVVPPPSKLPAPGPRFVWPVAVDTNNSGFDTRAAGSVLLAVGLVGAVPLTLFWLWLGPARRTFRTG
jgi:hypothetical protein